jgi:hypothetical protein
MNIIEFRKGRVRSYAHEVTLLLKIITGFSG